MRFSEPVPPMVHSWISGWGITRQFGSSMAASPSSSTWDAANQALYVPVVVPTTCVVRRLWWANGATVSASYNVDVGVYTSAGFIPASLLVSAGSTAQGTASTIQFVDVTDTVLAPGVYWLALACSSTSATFFRSAPGGATAFDGMYRMQQSSALPLPAAATPVASTLARLYLFGFATTASP